MLKVRQFYNKNQFIIIDYKKDEVWFQSYESTIAKVNNAKNKRQFILKSIRDGVVKIGKVNKAN